MDIQQVRQWHLERAKEYAEYANHSNSFSMFMQLAEMHRSMARAVAQVNKLTSGGFSYGPSIQISIRGPNLTAAIDAHMYPKADEERV